MVGLISGVGVGGEGKQDGRDVYSIILDVVRAVYHVEVLDGRLAFDDGLVGILGDLSVSKEVQERE